MRAFIALTLPPATRETLVAYQALLRPAIGRAVRWTPPEQLHITLQFLGDIRPEQADALTTRLRDAARAALSIEAAWRPAVEAFPTLRTPRVLWVGLRQGEDMVNALAARILEGTAALGIPAEERAFHAHATLGRVRSPADAVRVGCAVQTVTGWPATVAFRLETLVLMESLLTPQGPIHTPLATLRLGGGD